MNENPSYLSPGWIIAYVVIGGIIYYYWYKSKKDKEAASSSASPICFNNENGVRECYSQPLSSAAVTRLKQIYPTASPELKAAIDAALKQRTSTPASSSLYGVDPTTMFSFGE